MSTEHKMTGVHLLARDGVKHLATTTVMLPVWERPYVLHVDGKSFIHSIEHTDGSVSYREASAVSVTNDEVDKIVETLASTTADGIERAADLAERLLMAKPDISVLDVIALQRAAAGEIRKPSVQ